MNDSSSRHLFVVFGLALAALVMLSAFPWSSLTDNVIKDFDLFEDLFASDTDDELLAEVPLESAAAESSELEQVADLAAAVPVPTDVSSDEVVDVTTAGTEVADELPAVAEPSYYNDGILALESYLPGREILPKFSEALSQADSRLVRIAVIGDSFIEGDILTQDLRDILQSRYGGHGVGYMAMHTDFPGFRGSVRQSDNGWTMRDVRTMRSSDTIRTLAGEYALAEGEAHVRYQGVDKAEGQKAWSRSRVIFIAPVGGVITMHTVSGDAAFNVEASPEPQSLEVSGLTDVLSVRSTIPGLRVLGAYLDDPTGVQVDCMSVRGYAGAAHARTNVAMARDMARWVDYDLIIIEYGMNALSAEQKAYGAYGKTLAAVASHLGKCYPNADIMIMGISDRGTKKGTEVVTLPTCRAMVDAQRDAARMAGVHFWDARRAMGGPGSCADWRKRKLMNADYIHLNHAGGREMASLLSKALINALQ